VLGFSAYSQNSYSSIPVEGATHTGAVIESATGSEIIVSIISALGIVAETNTANDLITAKAGFVSETPETATATDAITTNAFFNSNVNETAASNDVIIAGLALFGLINETAQIIDSVDAIPAIVYQTAITESASGSDTCESNPSFLSEVNESGTALDFLASLHLINLTIQENSSTFETIGNIGVFNKQITEFIAGSVVSNVGGSFNVQVVNTATIADSVQENSPWSLIPTSQNANWVEIVIT
jgi:hypothetical protein